MAIQAFIFAASLAAMQAPPGATQAGAPAAPPTARYCLRVEPITGSRMETIRCETRETWALMDVDVDREWAENGVRVVTLPPYNG